MPKKVNQKPNKVKGNSYLKYSGIATKMAGTIFAGVFIGQKLDGYFENQVAYWTAGLSLLGVLGSFVSLYYSLKSDDEAHKV